MKKFICLGWLFFSVALAATPHWPREVSGQACGHAISELLTKFQAEGLESMTVAYYDTANLELQSQAINVRLRVEEDEGEITVKLRAENLPTMPAGGECEVDVYRGRALSACSWKLEISREDALAALAGDVTLRSLMSREQLDLIKKFAPNVSSTWLKFGPVTVDRWDIARGESGTKWRLENWILPDRSTLLSEVSFTEKKPQSLDELRKVLDTHFSRAQVERCDSDEPKTARVLRYFSGRRQK